jgi:hypothetical protein
VQVVELGFQREALHVGLPGRGALHERPVDLDIAPGEVERIEAGATRPERVATDDMAVVALALRVGDPVAAGPDHARLDQGRVRRADEEPGALVVVALAEGERDELAFLVGVPRPARGLVALPVGDKDVTGRPEVVAVGRDRVTDPPGARLRDEDVAAVAVQVDPVADPVVREIVGEVRELRRLDVEIEAVTELDARARRRR